MNRLGRGHFWLALALASGACRFGYEVESEAGIAGNSGAGGASNPRGGAAGSAVTGGNVTGGTVTGGNSGSSTGGVTTDGGSANSAGDAMSLSGAAGAGAIDATGLIAHLKFDEVSGNQAADATANQNHGTLVGFSSSGWRSGKFGGALTLDGAGNYVTLNNSPSLNRIAANDTFTVAAWVQTADGSPGYQTIGTIQHMTGNEEVLGLYINKARAVALVNSQSSATNSCFGPGNLPLNTWLHLATTFDGATLRLYVGGLEVCNVVPDVTDIPAEANPFVIGMNQNGSTPGEFLRGVVDELVVYDRALSGPEIMALSAGSLP